MNNKIERDKGTEGLEPYKFSLTKFSDLAGETVERAYSNYTWVQMVVKHNPVFWFAPNAKEDDVAEIVTVKDDQEAEEKIDALIFIKAWCDKIDVNEVPHEKTDKLKNWIREEEISTIVAKKIVNKIIELDFDSLFDLQNILDEE